MTEVNSVQALLEETPEHPSGAGELVLLGIPDLNGSIRGKALRPSAFAAALRDGIVMTDLLLALDPVDVPIADFERFGIRSGAGDMLVRAEPETVRDLSWRPGWSVCLGTPAWRDGRPCELASREVLRAVLGGAARLGYEIMAAFEYEVRLRSEDGSPLSSGISYSLAEVARFDDLLTRLGPALDGSRDRAHRRPHRGRAGAPRAQRRRAAGPAGGGRRYLPQARSQGRRLLAWPRRQLPGEDRRGRGRVQRARAPLLLERRRERLRVRPCGGPARGPYRRGRRHARSPSGCIAAPQSDDQLVQAPRSRLLRPCQRELGHREPLGGRSRHPLGAAGAVPDRVQAARAPTPTRISRWPLWSRRRSTASDARRSRPRPSRATRLRARTCRRFPAPSRAPSPRSPRTRSCGARSARSSASTTRSLAPGS